MAVTIKDIAKIAGVSITTVSRVVNEKPEGVGEETRARIKEVIEQYDFHPNVVAKSMITKRTKTIGLILPDVANPFFSDIAKSVESAAEEAGYNVFLCNSDENLDKERSYIRALTDKSVDGLVFIAASSKKRIVDANLFRMPVILIDRALPGEYLGVYSDNIQGGFDITDELISAGHREIAFIGGSRNDNNANDRFRGFKKACVKYGIEVKNSYIFFGDYTIQSGLGFAGNIAALGVTACVCANDLIAIGLISGLRKMGIRVPRDVSVTGFDDIAISEINDPPITTVKQPTVEMGRVAVKMLLDLIDKEGVPMKNVTLKTQLMIRESSKPIKE